MTSPVSATADWERLEDRFYRKILLYSELFGEDRELDDYIIAGAPYSGAIGQSFRFRQRNATKLRPHMRKQLSIRMKQRCKNTEGRPKRNRV
jgi:hypothetical protein